jgi:hypothetical protein
MGTLRPFDKLIYGRATVASVGTAVIIMTENTITESITIKALEANSGDVYVGDSAVTVSNGYPLSPGETISIDIDHDVDPVYIDAENNGNSIAYMAGRLE